MTKRISLLNLAHDLIRERLGPGGTAVDATIGNGHDTLFLARQVAPDGLVFGFDIQLSAIDSARNRCLRHGLSAGLTLFLADHASMAEQIPTRYHGRIRAVMFNLGYLPGGDKNVITRTDSTLAALTAACELIAPGGLITIMAYPGHAGGDTETADVAAWCERLSSAQFDTDTYYSTEHKDSAPRLFVLRKPD